MVADICDKAKVQLIVSGGRVADIGPKVKAIRPHITVHELTQGESLAYRVNANASGHANGNGAVVATDADGDPHFESIKSELASITVPDPAYLLHSTCVFLGLFFFIFSLKSLTYVSGCSGSTSAPKIIPWRNTCVFITCNLSATRGGLSVDQLTLFFLVIVN
jgi:hypothetical protein